MYTLTAIQAEGLQRLITRIRAPIALRWLLMLSVTYAALISLPPPVRFYGTGLDPSWVLGLNWARAAGLVAGRDIVFAYGPLGYLAFPEPGSGAPFLALAGRLGLYLISISAMYRLAWIMPSKIAAFWTALILALGVVLDGQPEESQVIIAIIAVALLVLVDRSHWRFTELSLLGFLAGLAFLIKLNHGIEGIALFLTVLAVVALQNWPMDRRSKRRLIAVAGLLPLSIAVLFLASTGNLLALGPYVQNGWQIVSGYSETMGLPGPLWQAALAMATFAATFAVVLVAAGDLRTLLPGLGPALITAFFVFKHAMVRQDGHAPSFHIKFALSLLFLLVCARLPRDRRLILILQLFSIVMAYAISVEKYPGFDSQVTDRLQLREAPGRLSAFLHWRATWDHVDAQYHAARAKLRLPDRFHQLIQGGSVDAVPWEVDVVRANGWKWQPRPVFQSYSAYTPPLDRLNAEHLESGSTSRFVLLSFSAIDGRHPFLETPLSWRALLDRYDLSLASSSWFLLQHRNDSRYGPPAPVAHSMAHWDEEVSVPQADGLLMMGPHIGPSLSGEVTSLLFRSAAVYMEGTFSSGRRVRWRCVPANLATGFLIRPFPQDLGELRELFLPDPAGPTQDRIQSVRFHAEKPGEFAAEIPVEWSRLPLRTMPAANAVSTRYPFSKASLTPLWLPSDRPPRPTNAQIHVQRNWIEAIPENDDPQLLFDIGPALGKFNTLIVRARFQKTDRIDAFFGIQVDGRGVNAMVPTANQWVDVYLNMSQNLFWKEEHGTMLRFDPVSSAGPGTTAYIAGIWGSPEMAPAAWPDVQFYPVTPSEIPPR